MRVAAVSLVIAMSALPGVADGPHVDVAIAELAAAWRAKQPEHPLLGRSWNHSGGAELHDLRTGRWMGSRSATITAMGISLVGEVHDNAEHHKIQAAGIDGETRSVVFEQLRTDQQPAIDSFMALPKESRTPDAFLKAVDWDKSGWAKYDYKPLFQAVIAAGLPIYGGDPPRTSFARRPRKGRRRSRPKS